VESGGADLFLGAMESRPTTGDDPMKNVQIMVEGNTLTIKVDLSKEFGSSSSGNTIIIASTEGSVSAPEREEKIS
jgi:hypothetical protein